MDDHQRSVTLRVCVSSGVSSALLSEVLEKECVFCVNEESLKFEEVKKKKQLMIKQYGSRENNEKTSFLG